LRLWITVVDWVTPFSLLYLYKHISVSKIAAEKTAETEYSKIRESTVGDERIKMLLEKEEST
jgi:hypothetical protein